MNRKTYVFDVSNSYGNLRVSDWGNDSYTLELDDYSSTSIQHISKELFLLMIEELRIIN